MERSSRRRLLGTVSTLAATAVAGCSSIVDGSGSNDLGDVVVLNETSRRRSGSITVAGPDGDQLGDEPFEILPAGQADGDSTPTGTASFVAATFENVFVGTGVYDVAVRLDEESAVDGVREATGEVRISDTDEEVIVAKVGDDGEEPITVEVETGGAAL